MQSLDCSCVPGPHVLFSPMALQFPLFVQLPKRFSAKIHASEIYQHILKIIYNYHCLKLIFAECINLPKTRTSRMWSYWSNVDVFPVPASTVNFQVPLSTGSVELSSS